MNAFVCIVTLIFHLGFGGALIGAGLEFIQLGSTFLAGILIALGAFLVIRAAIIYSEPLKKTE
jgi:hypothetical protein